jgi:predicted dienelactone hydrolase
LAVAIAALLLAAGPAAAAAAVDCNAIWHDDVRDRDVPVRIRMPDGAGRVPLVLSSPGLGGTTFTGSIWSAAWVAAGIAVIHLEHRGSDAAVYADLGTPEQKQARRRIGGSLSQLPARAGDAGFVLDEIARRTVEGACNLGRIDPSLIGFAGHSMGAWTAQAVAGQRFGGRQPFIDKRIKAAIALSPSSLTGGGLGEAFGSIRIPFMSITGSGDGVPAGADAAQRIAALAQRSGPYLGMAPGQKYLLVLADADHMAFAGTRRPVTAAAAAAAPGGGAAAVPTAHVNDLVRRLTTAFWDATLLGGAAGAAFVTAPAGLAAGDRYESK